MNIEDRISALEEIVQHLHGKTGHKWFKGTFFPLRKTGVAECACGKTEGVDEAGYEALPTDWQIEDRW